MTNPRLQTACDALGWKLLEPIKGGRERISLGWGAFEVGHPALVGPMLDEIRKVKDAGADFNKFGTSVWVKGCSKKFTAPTLAQATLAAFLEVFGG